MDLSQHEYNVLRVKDFLRLKFPPKYFPGRVRALFSTSPLAIAIGSIKE